MATKHRVKFTGPDVTVRQLKKAAEEKQGIVLPEDLEWSRSNGHVLFLEDLDESAIEYFKRDDEFDIREIKDAQTDVSPDPQ